jgi:iron complex transport system substrate-binding protein
MVNLTALWQAKRVTGQIKSNSRRIKQAILSRSWSRTLKLLMLGIVTTVSIVACGGNVTNNTISDRTHADPRSLSAPTDCRMVKHELGETKICGKPQKVVALGPLTLDLLLSLNQQPAAYADVDIVQNFHNDYNNPSQQIPYLGDRVTSQPINVGIMNEPSLETLYRLKPDLIVGEVWANEAHYNLLSQIAPTIIIGRDGKGEWKQRIRIIAEALGDYEKVQQVIKAHERQLAATRAQLAPVVAAHRRVLIIRSAQLSQTIALSNRNDFEGGLLEELGFQVVSLPKNSLTGESPNAISIEVLPQFDADIIIIQGSSRDRGKELKQNINQQVKQIQQQWNSNAIAQTMPASKEGHVYFVTLYLWRGLQGPIGTQLIQDELRHLLLEHN